MGEDYPVTVDEPTLAQPRPATSERDDPASRPAPRRTTQQQARDAYNKSLRRYRWTYAGVLAFVVIAAVVGVKVAYVRGEISHAHLRTVANPPAPVPTVAPAASVQPAWNTTDRAALGQPNWGGTVVTSTAHSVRGRDAVSGAITWSYTRTDRPLCDAIQDFGTTIAFFALHGDCDEVTALDTQTGARKWQRTLDKDDTREGALDHGIKGIQHVIGHPTYAISQFSLLVITPDVIYNLDPGGGLDRWTFAWSGCTIRGAVFGTQGALISQNCTHVNCGQLQFCGNGPQLLLRKGTDARADDNKNKTNPDQIIWNRIGVDALPVSADQVVSATDAAATSLTVFDPAKGSTLNSLPLSGASQPGAIAQVNTARGELVWVGGVTYAVPPSGAALAWHAASTGPPTVTALPGSLTTPVDLSEATVLVPTDTGVSSLDPTQGTVHQRYPVPAPAPGSSVYPLGAGFVVTGTPTAVYR
jgi:hypothetical protein